MKGDTLYNDVLVLLPAFNEERTIGDLIEHIHKLHPSYTILVINDESTDRTPEIVARHSYALLANLPRNLGIGGAVQTGFLYAVRNNFNFIVQLDSDGQHNPEDISKLIEPLKEGKADVVIGSRFCSADSSYDPGLARKAGINIISFFSMLLTGKRVKDCTSGFRAYNREAMTFLSEYYPVDYPEPEAIIMLAKNRFRILEVPVIMLKRKAGKSSISFRRGTTYYMFKVVLGMIMTSIRPKTRNYGKH